MKKLSQTGINELRQGYQKELQLYESIFKMDLEQNEAIKSGNLKKIFFFSNQKQEIISKINRIEARLSLWKKKWIESKFFLRDKELPALIKKIGSLLEKILLQEKENESHLRIFLENIGQSLEHIQTGKILHNAYRSYHEASARFMNQKR